MALAADAGTPSAAALALVLAAPLPVSAALPLLALPGVPAQNEIDRVLSVYEAWVYVDEPLPLPLPLPRPDAGVASSAHRTTGAPWASTPC